MLHYKKRPICLQSYTVSNNHHTEHTVQYFALIVGREFVLVLSTIFYISGVFYKGIRSGQTLQHSGRPQRMKRRQCGEEEKTTLVVEDYAASMRLSAAGGDDRSQRKFSRCTIIPETMRSCHLSFKGDRCLGLKFR
jgi:hypothetical protein